MTLRVLPAAKLHRGFGVKRPINVKIKEKTKCKLCVPNKQYFSRY